MLPRKTSPRAAFWVAATFALLSASVSVRAQSANPPPPGNTEVPVREVVLFSSGVGYFQHEGRVRGEASAELRFKTTQVNDILKSLVLNDLDGGRVGVVTYPSQDPLEKTLASFQVDISDNPSQGDLLNKLRGARITLSITGANGAETLSGNVLGVEDREIPGAKEGAPPLKKQYLNLVTDKGIRSLELARVDRFQLDDPGLQEELNRALAAVAGARDQDKKPVSIRFNGQGERRVRLGYVVATPIWKASYRLVLPDKDAKDKKGVLQGWAIVENQTDNDWQSVRLSLVSGRPISFIQDLYQPLYLPRPTVVPELYSSLRPQEYESGQDVKAQAATAQQPAAPGAAPVTAGNRTGTYGVSANAIDALLFGSGTTAKAPGVMSVAGVFTDPQFAKTVRRGGRARDGRASNEASGVDDPEVILQKSDPSFSGGGNIGAPAPASPPMDVSESVAPLSDTAKIGELFQYTVGNVSLARQKSAMIPIINDPVEAEKVSIYNQSVFATHPLNGARVKNTTEDKKHLLQGPITVFDGGRYAGDARIDDVPPGQTRLLSYGVDIETSVIAKDLESKRAIQTGKIIKGVLQVTQKLVSAKEYSAENKGEDARTLVIEHPLREGWKLVETPAPVETTDRLYRFQQALAPGKTEKFTVREESVQGQNISILNLSVEGLQFLTQNGEIPAAVRDALAKVATRKQASMDTQRQINEKDTQINGLSGDQSRIRENIKSVDRTSAYATRLLKKLDDQESQLEKMRGEVDTLRGKLEGQNKEFTELLNNLNVG